MTPIRTLIATALLLTLSAGAALAAPAVSVGASPLYSEADAGSRKLANVFPGQSVDLGACSNGWCQVAVNGANGYVPESIFSGAPAPQPQPQRPGNNNNNNNGGPGFNFDFGFGNGFPDQPQRPPRPRPEPPRYEDAQACFYSNINFRGSSFCIDRGQSYDYLPDDWDNRIRSVEVFGRARVDLCRDEDLGGACVTLRSSQERLPSQLDRRASSLEVY